MFTIRAMKSGDLPQAMSLVSTTEGLAFKSWESQSVLQRALTRNKKLSQVVVDDNGAIVGSVFIGEGLMTMVHHLAVHPQARGQKLGSQLVKAGLKALYETPNASRRVYITVLPSNQVAQAFWEAFGCTKQATGNLVLYTLDLGDQEWLASQKSAGIPQEGTAK